jgi:capsular polysaccharide biosynthesis protein
MNLAFRRQIDQIRTRWWVIVIVAAIAVAASVLSSLTPQAKYVGKATFAVSSPQRAPEQDEKVVLGYATIFNDPATTDRLKAVKSLPENVTYEAKTVAASPILTIEATADNPKVAQESATKMAEAFRDDVNAAQRKAAEAEIADLQSQIDDVLQRFPTVPGDQPTEIETTLRERINTLKFDPTNQLRDLQLDGGVTPIAPHVRRNIALGSAAGLLLGVLAAVGMAAVSRRIRTSAELLEKTGIEPLVEVPGGRSRQATRVREDQLCTLANILGAQISSKSTVMALIDSRGAQGAAEIAGDLAKVLAQQEFKTILVPRGAPQADGNAVTDDALRERRLTPVLRDGEVETLKILARGAFFANQHSHMTRARIAVVLDKLRGSADAVVLVAPSITETPDAQLLCAAADLTIVVVDARSSRADDVTSVVSALERVGAFVLGGLLINGSRRQSSGSTIAPRAYIRHSGGTPAQRSRHADTAVSDLHQ